MRTNLLFCLTLLGCSAQAPTTGTKTAQLPNGTGSLTIQTFIEQLDTADCAHAFGCQAAYPSDATTSFTDAYGSSAQDCVEGDADFAARDDYGDSVDAGRITFDATAAAACLTDLQFPSTCADYFDSYDYPQSCYDAIVGQVLPGNACTTDYDCYGYGACLSGTCSGGQLVATPHRHRS